MLQIHCVLQSLFDGRFKSIVFYRRGRRDGGVRQSLPSHSGEAPRGQSDAQARRIRSIGFLEASRGFKEASKKLQEASWRLQEASKRHPRGFKRLQEASKRLQEASKRLQEASRGLKRLQEAFKSKSDAQARRIRGIGPFLLQIHCVLQSLFLALQIYCVLQARTPGRWTTAEGALPLGRGSKGPI